MKIENLTNLLPSQPRWSAWIEYSNMPPQVVAKPTNFDKCSTFGQGNGFMNISASISSVPQKEISRIFISYNS
jgi:hypothetical protein